jgi:RNA-directed DNA polymerase
VNTGAPSPTPNEASARVLGIQTKLHRWASEDPARRFADLFNLVADPATLTEAWRRVRTNRGARSAGVDGTTAHAITARKGEAAFLAELHADLTARRFAPVPVRERLIPKPGGKQRRLGIPTVKDRVVQAALKLVLEPIFEADFQPCAYGFRPGRRAQDAIAEIHHFGSHAYTWVLEGDITACFDEIDHTALLTRVRRRVADKRVLALIKAFLKAGILTQDGHERDAISGTPQGGILSPLLSNVALSVLDDHFTEIWQTQTRSVAARQRRRRHGLPNYRLIRYADDFVVMVNGTREQTEALQAEVVTVLAPIGLRLSLTKTRIAHLDDGFDFLGFRIQRQTKRGSTRCYLYTYPSKTALAAVKAKVRTITRGSTHHPLAILLHRLAPVLRGWATYFQHGVSKDTFAYLDAFTWHRVVSWLRHKHHQITWKQLRRRYLPGWRPTDGNVTLFNPATITVTRYRWRGNRIPTPWPSGQPAASP